MSSPEIEHPQAAYDVRVGVVAGRTVLVRGNQAFEVNDVGAFLWDRFSGEASVDELVGAVAAEYEISVEDARSDVGEFTAALAEAGLLE